MEESTSDTIEDRSDPMGLFVGETNPSALHARLVQLAKKGQADPASLSFDEVQHVCYALVLFYSKEQELRDASRSRKPSSERVSLSLAMRYCLASAQVMVAALAGITGLGAYRGGVEAIVLGSALVAFACISTCVILVSEDTQRAELENRS